MAPKSDALWNVLRGKLGNGEHLFLEAYKHKENNIHMFSHIQPVSLTKTHKIRYPVRKIVHINSNQNWNLSTNFYVDLSLHMYFLIIRINKGGSIDHLIVGQ